MKEVNYESDKFEILDIGKYKGKDYVIIYVGSHPCAYVECDIDYYNECNNPNYDEPAHCGFTFYGSLSHWEKKEILDEKTKQFFDRYFIGWDYAHLGDYTKFKIFKCDKKWTTEEILENVKEVIEWLRKKEYEATGV